MLFQFQSVSRCAAEAVAVGWALVELVELCASRTVRVVLFQPVGECAVEAAAADWVLGELVDSVWASRTVSCGGCHRGWLGGAGLAAADAAASESGCAWLRGVPVSTAPVSMPLCACCTRRQLPLFLRPHR